MRLGVCLAVAAAGCFSPDISGGLLCQESGKCPPGFRCDPDGVCRDDSQSIDADPPTPDAAPASFRRPISITGSGSALTDYQVEVALDTNELIADGKMRADCGDVRFTDEMGGSLVYFLESGCDTATTTLWVRVESIPTDGTTIYVRYGNPQLMSSSDGATFEWFDDFSSDTSANYTVTGQGWLNGSYDGVLGSVSWDSTNENMAVTSADNAMTLIQPTGLSIQDVAVDVSFSGGALYPTSQLPVVLVRALDMGNWCGGIATLTGSTQNHTGANQRAGGTLNNLSTSTMEYPLASQYDMTVAVAGSRIAVGINQDRYEASLPTITTGDGVLVGSVQLDVGIDDLRVRKFAIPVPVATVGAEESL